MPDAATISYQTAFLKCAVCLGANTVASYPRHSAGAAASAYQRVRKQSLESLWFFSIRRVEVKRFRTFPPCRHLTSFAGDVTLTSGQQLGG